MDFLTSLRISSSGLAANRKRMGAISSNIANAQTTRTAEGGAYRKKEVVFGASQQENLLEIFLKVSWMKKHKVFMLLR
jgi:flagellar basal body rod protein FlgC